MAISRRFTLRHSLFAATLLASPLILAVPHSAHAQMAVGISITVAPPMLPVYEQPPMPELGYVWTPGYWAYGQMGYYWVPGTWVMPPEVGLFWTPPYWSWNDGEYVFNNGYWGPHVGYYGGVNYGYGYGGDGYDGGRWHRRHFEYNRDANNFGSVHVSNAYQQPLIIHEHSRVSYAGGQGGLRGQPTAQDQQAAHDRHIQATNQQTRNISAAAANPAFSLSHNNGHPAIPATSRPGAFGGGGNQRPPASGSEHPVGPATFAHPAQPMNQPAAPAHPMGPAAFSHPTQPMNRPVAPQHQMNGQQQPMSQPAAPAHPMGPAAFSHPAQPMNRPAAPQHQMNGQQQPMNRPAAPQHQENGQQQKP